MSIIKLLALRVLDLSFNRFVELPFNIGDLKKLTCLDLSENHLAALPPSVGDLKSLTRINLKNNEVSDLPQDMTCVLKKLKEFNITSNRFKPEKIAEIRALLPQFSHLDAASQKSS